MKTNSDKLEQVLVKAVSFEYDFKFKRIVFKDVHEAHIFYLTVSVVNVLRREFKYFIDAWGCEMVSIHVDILRLRLFTTSFFQSEILQNYLEQMLGDAKAINSFCNFLDNQIQK
jgi:hypothetical protein